MNLQISASQRMVFSSKERVRRPMGEYLSSTSPSRADESMTPSYCLFFCSLVQIDYLLILILALKKKVHDFLQISH
jgi:hypothetical protein